MQCMQPCLHLCVLYGVYYHTSVIVGEYCAGIMHDVVWQGGSNLYVYIRKSVIIQCGGQLIWL